MAAPFPYDAVAGRASLGQIAAQIVANYKWLARWSQEIGTDTNMDLKKLAQLAFSHCRLFRDLIQPFIPVSAGDPIIAALQSEFAWHGLVWPTRAEMVTDVGLLYQRCGALFDYVRDNVPAARSFAVRTYDANGNEIEQPTVIAKDAAVATEVGRLRALFV